MKKYHFKKVCSLVFFFLLFISIVNAQDQKKIIGTIGDEKHGTDAIVICVYGTSACMPVNIDTKMTVKFDGHETKLTQLPFGLYLEAQIVNDTKRGTILKEISIDEDKTVICLSKLKKGQEKTLGELLKNIQGVKSYKLNQKSNQIYIEYNHKIIAYKSLENKIKKAGFELE